MIIRCWGARGSIPVSGNQYNKYGGDTTCIEIRTSEDDLLIIDAGTGIRNLGKLLVKEKRSHLHLLFTHAHLDHLMGLLFFAPLFRSDVQIDVYGGAMANQDFRTSLDTIWDEPYTPISLDEVKARLTFHEIENQTLQIGSVQIETIPLTHPNGGFGYKFIEQNKTFVFLTDNELSHSQSGLVSYQQYVDFCKNADLLIHDAEFTHIEYESKKGWGHSRMLDALNLAIQANVKQFGLFHHNQDRSDDALDALVMECKNVIHEQPCLLECFAVAAGMQMTL